MKRPSANPIRFESACDAHIPTPQVFSRVRDFPSFVSPHAAHHFVIHHQSRRHPRVTRSRPLPNQRRQQRPFSIHLPRPEVFSFQTRVFGELHGVLIGFAQCVLAHHHSDVAPVEQRESKPAAKTGIGLRPAGLVLLSVRLSLCLATLLSAVMSVFLFGLGGTNPYQNDMAAVCVSNSRVPVDLPSLHSLSAHRERYNALINHPF
jgi:hypothetical protein